MWESFSTIPLRVWTYIGFAISFLSLSLTVYFLLRTLIYGVDVPGFASLIVSVTFLSGIQLLSLGVLGEYVGRIFAEVKRRPLYLIAEHNFMRRANVQLQADRRGEILAAAQTCFARSGFHQTSMQEICTEAAMSPDSVSVWWFDHWLKGKQNGVENQPPVRVFVMGANCWQT